MNLRVFYLYKTVGFGWLRRKSHLPLNLSIITQKNPRQRNTCWILHGGDFMVYVSQTAARRPLLSERIIKSL